MKRLARTSSHAAAEGDNEGSWAISYGDMVTLLLAFFILFFSIDPQKTEDSALARSLLATLAPLATKADVSRPIPDSHGDVTARPVDPELATKLGAELTQIGNKIIVEFPAVSFFQSGRTELTKSGELILTDFAKLYVPYAGKHMLNILGFTDERPIKSRQHGPRDNLELSALRAVAALRHLQNAGIPLDRMRLGGHGVKRVELPKEDAARKAEQMAMARRIALVVEPEK